MTFTVLKTGGGVFLGGCTEVLQYGRRGGIESGECMLGLRVAD